MERIFLVLVDLCMNYWEIRLQSDLWRAALGSGCLGCGWQVCQDSHYCGLDMGAVIAVLAMRENCFLHQFNIFLIV